MLQQQGQGQQEHGNGQLARLDAGVESQQALDESGRGQAELAENVGEAEAVNEAEEEREPPAVGGGQKLRFGGSGGRVQSSGFSVQRWGT